MKKFLAQCCTWLYRLLADTRFFVFSVVLFLVHAVWLALSAYSLPFDEYFHLGFIKAYSHQWLPFIASQPTSAAHMGDLTRLPSYLYHYLMSFPYRFFEIFTGNQYLLTVLMRLLNIGLVIIGVILWRKLLFKIGISRRLAHLSIFVFLLLPLVVLVAAESNYDNLLFLLTPMFLFFAVDLARGNFKVTSLVGYFSVGLIACLVKNEFLLILLLSTFLGSITLLQKRNAKAIIRQFWHSARSCSWMMTISLIGVSIVAFGLFVERYGVNLARYHSINVDCAKVQSVATCSQYSPWQRNHLVKQQKKTNKLYGNSVSFSQHWLAIMMRGFVANFANVPAKAKPSDPYGNYEFRALLPMMSIVVYAALATFLFALAIKWRSMWRLTWLRYSILLIFLYAGVLWLFNYRGYLILGRSYAVQPRYLYPLLILLLVAIARVIGMVVVSVSKRALFAGLTIGIFVYSGGIFGWIIRSNPYWFWPNQTVISVNQNAQRVLKRVIVH